MAAGGAHDEQVSSCAVTRKHTHFRVQLRVQHYVMYREHNHVLDIISHYCAVSRTTDEVASLQLQTPHGTNVSTEGSDQQN